MLEINDREAAMPENRLRRQMTQPFSIGTAVRNARHHVAYHRYPRIKRVAIPQNRSNPAHRQDTCSRAAIRWAA